ncbi:hypothetical protein QCA50_005162 [Cerrena zonata]|uniref:N-acetyltransferase domain-containing protein n=1 Tax=Cerrena zonata TaxID=2478898 RepID=A0AAW0GEG0_9APHY
MSAYGVITTAGRPKEPLASTLWHTKVKDPQSAQTAPKYLTLHHLTLATAEKLPGLISYLHKDFAEELERGRTYPQEILQGEEYTQSTFESYFFAADAIVAITGYEDTQLVKPNYPGRSSHICNAGFLIPASQRNRGFGSTLARSYLHYGPRLGYEASVFNLVYVNNIASVKLWDALGFTKIGRLPNAGRLKKADGSGEEYVDAWIIHKQFDKVDNAN